MKRALVLASVLAVTLAGAAFADPRFVLLAPVEIDNVPAALIRGAIACRVSSAASFNSARIIGEGRSEFAIEGGRYSGRVGVEVFPRGFPVGVDGTLEGRSYSCTLTFMYRCASGDADGMCSSGGGGAPIGGSPEPIARLFATDPARPRTGEIVGTINRETATTLPVYR